MEPNTQQQAPVETQNQTPQTSGGGDHKLWAIIGYILPFLFFIPMLDEKAKHDTYVRFHAEQQLALLVVGLGVFVAMSFIGGFMFFIAPLCNLALLVFAILGIISAAKGEMKELPLIGGIKLLDKVFNK
jgi:uncharacterized membrane protein